MSNQFMALSFELAEVKRRKIYRDIRSMSAAASVFTTVKGGVITDGFYRDSSEKGKPSGRTQHLGIDVSVPKTGDGSFNDPRRGVEVYAAINTSIPMQALNSVRAYNKPSDKKLTGVGINGTGNAELIEGIIKPQPWKPDGDMSYGGIVGIACHYQYTKTDGSKDFFTLYVEYLHLITAAYLAKNKSGVVATPEEWAATGKPSGFGPEIIANAKWDKVSFLGPLYSLVGYLGATQTPHVHIQVAYSPGKVTYARDIRVDPELVIY